MPGTADEEHSGHRKETPVNFGFKGGFTSSLFLVSQFSVNEVYTYTIECPENMELRTPETDKTIRNAAGSLTISVKKNGRTATVTRSLELNKQLYTPAEYKELRQLLTEWSDINGKTLLFSVQ